MVAKISRTSSLNGKKSGSYKKSEFSILDNCSKFIKNGSSANKWGNWSCSLSYKKSWYPFDFKVSYPLIEPSKFLMDFFYCSWLLRFLYGLYLNPLRIWGWGDPPTPSGGMVHKKTLWVSDGENTKDMHVQQSVFCDNSYYVSPGILRKKFL